MVNRHASVRFLTAVTRFALLLHTLCCLSFISFYSVIWCWVRLGNGQPIYRATKICWNAAWSQRALVPIRPLMNGPPTKSSPMLRPLQEAQQVIRKQSPTASRGPRARATLDISRLMSTIAASAPQSVTLSRNVCRLSYTLRKRTVVWLPRSSVLSGQASLAWLFQPASTLWLLDAMATPLLRLQHRKASILHRIVVARSFVHPQTLAPSLARRCSQHRLTLLTVRMNVNYWAASSSTPM